MKLTIYFISVRVLLLWSSVSFIAQFSMASHQLAGQISLRHITGFTYEITLTTYSDPALVGVDRCEADLEIWLHGAISTQIDNLTNIHRENGPVSTTFPADCSLTTANDGEPVLGSVKRNIYRIIYTFPEANDYEIRFFDVARREDVINMNDPGSTSIYLATSIVISPENTATNNTPVFLTDPIDRACSGNVFTLNGGAIDPDGDSLSYAFRPSFQYEPGQDIPPMPVENYRFPTDTTFDNGPLTIDPETGLITWENPVTFGVYNIAYTIDEFRDGILISSTIRDLAFFVSECENEPPEIIEIGNADTSNIQVAAGDSLQLTYRIYDPNPGDSLYIQLSQGFEGSFGPYLSENIPTASIITSGQNATSGEILSENTFRFATSGLTSDTLTLIFNWIPTCEDIRAATYPLHLFVHDNINYFKSPVTALLSRHVINPIQVTPPSIDSVNIVGTEEGSLISWSAPSCQADLEGYRIYKQSSSDSLDTFVLVGKLNDPGELSFLDNSTLETQRDACYSVSAVHRSLNGREVESMISNSTCTNLITSVENDIRDLGWKLSLLPDQQTIHIEFSPATAHHGIIRLLDIQGRIMKNVPINQTSSLHIAADGMAKGLYIIQWHHAKGTNSKKFIWNY